MNTSDVDALKLAVETIDRARALNTEETYAAAEQAWKLMNGACIDTLRKLMKGPVQDGDLPSKVGRNILLEVGLAVQICVNFESGYTAATNAAHMVFHHGRDNG